MWSRISVLAFCLTILFTVVCVRFCTVMAGEKNGFDVANSILPTEQILSGGPGKDGIPALDDPKFVGAKTVTWLPDNSQVLSLTLGSETRAYPLAILNWHEVVNDVFSGDSVIVSYCPLCGTGMAFYSTIDGKKLSFGVSGLLYNSDVLFYDHETMSLWSQIMEKAISGPMVSKPLKRLPLMQTTWIEWKKAYPHGKVLSRDTGFSRNYAENPYAAYEVGGGLYFPVTFRSQRYHPKERILGLEVGGMFKAYPFAELAKLGGRPLLDSFNGQKIKIVYNSDARTGAVSDHDSGKVVPTVNAFWFAWYAFHPNTEVYSVSKNGSE